MKLQLNETQFRNMLTEMVRNVLLEATTPEDIKKQCMDIMYNFFLKTKGQFTANYFRTHTFEHEDNPENLNFYDYMYKQFFETFFHSRTDQIHDSLCGAVTVISDSL